MSGFDSSSTTAVKAAHAHAHGQHIAAGLPHAKGNTVHVPVPDTVVGEAGSAKRNIIRKGKKRGGTGGKTSVDIDDGSNYAEAGGALDEYDPNYDSEVRQRVNREFAIYILHYITFPCFTLFGFLCFSLPCPYCTTLTSIPTFTHRRKRATSTSP
jgi:hypothetical protein